ncbi:hypothetical protein HLB23_10225 [Nocardia uniformis]|uniref:Uncharacterized protein n=1 Tax=Nocardia uniformis TaxID=53432 RepID=A0A849BVK4_9NOCA|nr:hypothetical protein [Nocardia uniformis]NNH70234.1 hypothetical protein [Nocardia uniformis]
MRSGRAAIGFWLGAFFGLAAALVTIAFTVAGAPGNLHGAINITAALYGAWVLGWLCGPILTGSSDETLQPEHFRLLPLSNRQLAYGLAAASFAGVAVVVNLLAFSGLVFLAAQYGMVPALFAVVGVILQLIFVVLLARAMTGWIGAAMRSRRGRDLGVLLAGLLGLAYYPLNLLIGSVGPTLRDAPDAVATALRVAPSGWAPYAVEAAADGNWLLAVLPLLGLGLLSLLLWQAWATLLGRRLTTPPAPAAEVRANGETGLLERTLPSTPIGAVVGKELRTWWRDSRRRATLLPLLLIGFVLPIFIAIQNDNSQIIPFAGSFVVWLAAMAGANLYGFDGTAVWQTIVTPSAARADVRGRVLAWLLLVAPVALLASLVLPGVLGQTRMYPWGLATLPVLLGVGAGAVVFLSTYAPYPLPPQRGNPFAASGNPGCAKILLQLGVGLGQLVACAPVLVILGIGAVRDNSFIMWSALPVGIGLGLAAGLLGVNLATKRLETRGPELLDAVKPR